MQQNVSDRTGAGVDNSLENRLDGAGTTPGSAVDKDVGKTGIPGGETVGETLGKTSDESGGIATDGSEKIEEIQEIGGPKGAEPTRFGDWERNGRCSDF